MKVPRNSPRNSVKALHHGKGRTKSQLEARKSNEKKSRKQAK